MKRFFIVGFAMALLVGAASLLGAVNARAEDELMTEAHIRRIRNNCVEAQSTLYQLHASDALLRVNRGQLYESISTKLMRPMNSRLSLNSYDASDMVSVAASYDRQLTAFRQNYKDYEETMSKTLQINCINQPVAFYDSVAETRTKRAKVHDSAVALHKTIEEYGDAFDDFAKGFKEANK